MSLRRGGLDGLTLDSMGYFSVGAPAGPTQVRVTFVAGAAQALQLDHVSIGVQLLNETTVSAPVQLLFSGGSGFTIAANGTITSDWATLNVSSSTGAVYSASPSGTDGSWSGYSVRTKITPVTGGTPLIVVCDVNAISGKDAFGDVAGQLYYQSAAATYSQAAPSGSWTSYAHSSGVSLVETQ